MFKKFLCLNLKYKITLTYFLTWLGFLISFSFGKFLIFLSNILKSEPIKKPAEIAKTFGEMKFYAVSSVISQNVSIPYLSYALSYIINNSISCMMIIAVFALAGYLSSKEKAEEKEYLRFICILFIFAIANPITALIGVNLEFKDLIAIVPHGIFEFFGYSLAVVLGLELANIFYPIKEKVSIKSIAILLMSIFTFISIAGFLEPIDWLIYNYAKANNLDLFKTFFTVYKSLIWGLNG
ncbi:hypothetical protein J422_00641 [Methanocaldococcus villosus KIN24-T80]|uniref:Stage II sporulation protein M n=1 Tax=Methanocaldococcus villosus KIN24-T80 TaxID=1069083 RepID=N6VU39_9EURY|nr:hypothetical protein [Methanocaldococcus villosus]ENN96706.1 hypothetical protein J422_00641 [Methanocaldococcus villosus KIN24-T80]